MRSVLLGPPASGKGTQGRVLADSLGLAYLSTGALLRDSIAGGSPLGLKAAPILALGGYLPDGLMLPILAAWLAARPAGEGWVLDGFPRSVPQFEFLESSPTPPDLAFHLDGSGACLVERVMRRIECSACRWSGDGRMLKVPSCPVCGSDIAPRPDDTVSNFQKRFEQFSRSVLPVIDRYRALGRLSCVSALQPAEEISTRLLANARISDGAASRTSS